MKIDEDGMQELLGMEAVTVCSTLTSLLGRSVKMVVTDVAEAALEDLPGRLPHFHVALSGVRRGQGIQAGFMYICGTADMVKLANFIMGLPLDTDNPLDEIGLSTIKEVAAQAVSAGSAELAEFLGREIELSFTRIDVREGSDQAVETAGLWRGSPSLICATFLLSVEGIASMELFGIYSAETAGLMGMPEPVLGQGFKREKGMIAVQEAVFPELKYAPVDYRAEHFGEEHERLMEISLDVAVRIGGTVCSVREILDLKQGQVLVLDKQAGSPADVVVNDILIGRGDVLVTGDRFGARIIEITAKEK